ncbi:uncharacterized protein [Eurosta solidaginis]|uniref:uncharacterized protein n=1 Tax=Eurosta solidaginis TaxID=178769 RepID=UPI0035316AF1
MQPCRHYRRHFHQKSPTSASKGVLVLIFHLVLAFFNLCNNQKMLFGNNTADKQTSLSRVLLGSMHALHKPSCDENCPKSPNQIQDLWKEISTNLNSMVGPARTPDDWRESLRNWRKQLRARARKLISERRRTGGGINPVAELTDFEQQALETFGIAAVEGHSNSRLGFDNESNAAPEVGPSCTDLEELIGDEDAAEFQTFA